MNGPETNLEQMGRDLKPVDENGVPRFKIWASYFCAPSPALCTGTGTRCTGEPGTLSHAFLTDHRSGVSN